MNKLTTINTIKKAAPLVLLAVVMSGSAFAGPPNNSSIDVFNDCRVKTKDKYGDPVPPQLVITSTISKSSKAAPTLGTIYAYPEQKGKKEPKTRGPNRFEPLGAGVSQGAVMGENPITIYLCSQDPELNPDTNVLNADIVVEVLNSRKGIYTGRCDDDPATYCSYEDAYGNEVVYYCEEKDESIVNVDPGICL